MSGTVFPTRVRKRDGSVVRFEKAKIHRAVERAAFEILRERAAAKAVAAGVTPRVVETLRAGRGKIPGIETIQDAVETILMNEGYPRIARSYILYREKRRDLRLAKSALGVKDDLKLPFNSMEVLQRRYLRKDGHGNVVETPGELFRRVASAVARAEKNFRFHARAEAVEERFYQLLRSREFLPNSPTLMNAGTGLGQLSACFVIPVEDSMTGIFRALGNMARIHQTGGGTGFDFSPLRPKGDLVSTTGGQASGPVSFMSIFDRATGVIVQGGRRRGANMGILRCDHPDIVEFIHAKEGKDAFVNFNLSVAVTDRFMEAVGRDGKFDLINPRNGRTAKTIKARFLFELIAAAAWKSGEPGLIFLDEINRRNPLPGAGPMAATNPCGEQPLLPYESCNLGSLNLARMVKKGAPDWEKIRDGVHWSIRFLDDAIEANRFSLPEIRTITLANRKVGLGVMGFADMLIGLGVAYGSPAAAGLAEGLMRFIRRESLRASAELARERGVFPNFRKSIYAGKGLRLRNAAVNTIAPTGTISIIAGCSSGIEPLFAVSFIRNVLAGERLFELHPAFAEAARSGGFYEREILSRVARAGSLRGIRQIPSRLRRLFVTAFDLTPEQHLRVQAAFQRYTDNAVAKTVNLPAGATVGEVGRIYRRAHELKCKGITVYRYGSREDQVLAFAGGEAFAADYPEGCRWRECEI